jgi:hypothetical protein
MKTQISDFGEETIAWSNAYSFAGVRSNIPVCDLDERLRAVEKRLAIISNPSAEVLENYPALRNAYEEYCLIEKLIGETHERNK